MSTYVVCRNNAFVPTPTVPTTTVVVISSLRYCDRYLLKQKNAEAKRFDL